MGVRAGTESVMVPADELTPRLLSTADIPAGMRLKEAAGWNQTETDWRNVLSLAPDGCFGIECDGDLRATTTVVCFGRELAWIGMVLTGAAYRGQGLARRLMEHVIEYLRRREVNWIKLDATDMGRPLYARLGFQEETAIERWIRSPRPLPMRGQLPDPFVLDSALDREAFGADRSQLLGVLAGIESASVTGAGFAMGRAGSRAAYFGPCVARSGEVARDLLAWFLEKHAAESVYWDILPGNGDAVRIAREFGFERARELVRMTLAGGNDRAPLGNNDTLVFATAGFEYG
jgi:GNAT superfamily N-acetyltransferase